jgi:hypothetical protein
MRDCLEELIENMESEKLQELYQDPYLLAKLVLELCANRWAEAIRDHGKYALPGVNAQYSLVATDDRLLEKESFAEYLKHILNMLRIDLQLFHSLRSRSTSSTEDWENLEGDYKFLAGRFTEQIKENLSSIPIITAMIALDESRIAIAQASDVK